MTEILYNKVIAITLEPVGKSSLQYVCIVSVGARIGYPKNKVIDHKFRIVITSYHEFDKSSAEVSMWAAGSWKFVHRLSAQMMDTSNEVRNKYEEDSEFGDLELEFKEDRDELLRIATEICFD